MRFLRSGPEEENQSLVDRGVKCPEYDSGLGTEIELDSARTVIPMDNEGLSGSVLSAHNISYTVRVSTSRWRRKVDTKILFNVTGVFKGGMNAILGPTGCGKTTFLDILADRKDPCGLEGQRLLDGKPLPDNFKCMVGYVLQNDTVMGTLTVRENLAFSAALRLPTTMSPLEKQERVEKVIKELGLQDCADRRVGHVSSRGVSGGEKKRCNIGMEMIISPSILLLDEPTTGLDANTAYTVLSILHRMSRGGCTVIFSIHQPRYTIYQLFDTIMLLADGSTIYFGPAQDAISFFAQQGFQCPAYNNPPDFFLDVINGISKQQALSDSMDIKGDICTSAQLANGFKESVWNEKLVAEADSILSKYGQGRLFGDRHPRVDYATCWSHQMLVVTKVTLQSLWRNPEAVFMLYVKSFIVTVLLGAVFWQVIADPIAGFENKFGGLYYLILQQTFLHLGALEVFISDREMFLHESLSGYYRVSVYFLARVLCDSLLLRLPSTFIWFGPLYFCMGFRTGVDHFCLFIFVMCILSLNSAGQAIFLGCMMGRAMAHLVYVLIMTCASMFAGFFVKLSSITSVLRWLQHLSVIRYGFTAQCINELKDSQLCGPDNKCKDGNTELEYFQMSYETAWDYWCNIVFIVCYGLIMYVGSYIRLRSVNKFT